MTLVRVGVCYRFNQRPHEGPKEVEVPDRNIPANPANPTNPTRESILAKFRALLDGLTNAPSSFVYYGADGEGEGKGKGEGEGGKDDDDDGDGGKNDDDDDDDDDDGEGDDGDDGDGEGDDDDKKFSSSYVRKLRAEAKKNRIKARELEEKQKQREREEMDEKERAELEKKEAEDLAKKLEEELAQERIHNSITAAAASHGFTDPNDAALYITADDLNIGKDGRPTSKSLKSAFETLIKEKPYLVSDGGGGTADGGGRKTAPTNKDNDEKALDDKMKKFQERLRKQGMEFTRDL